MSELWEKIVGAASISWENWGQYFLDNHSDTLGDLALVDRFNQPKEGRIFPSRGGIVFFTTTTGENIPVGIIVSHGPEEGSLLYHKDYINSSYPAVSSNIPKNTGPISLLPGTFQRNKSNISSFITNRGSEGWKSYLEAISLGQLAPQYFETMDKGGDAESEHRLSTPKTQLERLLTFGRDIPGAFWIMDIDRDPDVEKAHHNILTQSAIKGRSTISGAQPKILGKKQPDGQYYPSRFDEIDRMTEVSSHIFKIGTNGNLPIIFAEFLAMEATRAWAPEDEVAKAQIVELNLGCETKVPALAIERFDRTTYGGRRHFTEMTELLNLSSGDKRNGSYRQIAETLNPSHALHGQAYEQTKILYKRLLMHFLVGNFDNHLKNFAIFNDTSTLTPNYDIESTELFGYKHLALAIDGHKLTKDKITAELAVKLGMEIGVTFDDMRSIFKQLELRRNDAIKAIEETPIAIKEELDVGEIPRIRGQMVENLEKRWKALANYEQVITKTAEAFRAKAQNGGREIPRILQPLIFSQFPRSGRGGERQSGEITRL